MSTSTSPGPPGNVGASLSVYAQTTGKRGTTLTQVQNIRPEDIERESFRIIEQEFFSRTGRRQEEFSDREFAILQRVIHATGDFSLADSIRFHPQAIDRGLAAIRAGRNVYVDVSMVAAGIGGKLSAAFGGRVICRVGEEEVARASERERANAGGNRPGDGERLRTSALSRSAMPRPRSLPPSNWCGKGPSRPISSSACRWDLSTPPNPRNCCSARIFPVLPSSADGEGARLPRRSSMPC